MQDTPNLIKKIKVTYPKFVANAIAIGDRSEAQYWRDQIAVCKKRLDDRNENRLNNIKQEKKSKGHP